MAERVTIPASLAAEIAADLAAGGERAARWRPDVEPGTEVMVLERLALPTLHPGDVGTVAALRHTPDVPEAIGVVVGDPDDPDDLVAAYAWAPIADRGARVPTRLADRILILAVKGMDHDEAAGLIGSVHMTLGSKLLDADLIGVPLGDKFISVVRWAVLPGAAEPSPGEASAPGNPHGGHDMYELTIRIPMAAFTGAPNADPRLDRLVDLAMGLFPGADATGAPAWLEDGPPPCPTCGATDRAERRHRAHADAEAALRELVRWLTAERDRLDGYDRRAYAYSVVLDHLRGQGLDIDYLAQPPAAKETPDA